MLNLNRVLCFLLLASTVCIAHGVHKKNLKNVLRVNSPKRVHDVTSLDYGMPVNATVTIMTLPVSYSSPQIVSALGTNHYYYEIDISCHDAAFFAAWPYARLIVNSAEKNCETYPPAVEVTDYANGDKWDASTVRVTNYDSEFRALSCNGNPIIFSLDPWKDGSNKKMYIRLGALNKVDTLATIQLSFQQSGPVTDGWIFDPFVFGNEVKRPHINGLIKFRQFAGGYDFSGEVPNDEWIAYKVTVCADGFETNDWTVTATILSDPDGSACNVALCKGDIDGTTCSSGGTNTKNWLAYDVSATQIVSVQASNDQNNKFGYNGFYVSVMGRGSKSNKLNNFTPIISLWPPN